MRFRDRAEAGELLAARLESHRDERPVVLGLTRGGVPVALEVASRLRVGLDVVVVRKIAAPTAPQHALGAVAEGGLFVNVEAAHELNLRETDVAALARSQREEVERRIALYRGGRALQDLSGRTVLLVDDGVATGTTARAACSVVRALGARRVVLAAPVVAARAEPMLRATFDDIVALDRPLDVVAVSSWYGDFHQVSDAEVLACLRTALGAERRGGSEVWDGEWIDGAEHACS